MVRVSQTLIQTDSQNIDVQTEYTVPVQQNNYTHYYTYIQYTIPIYTYTIHPYMTMDMVRQAVLTTQCNLNKAIYE